ncbi:Gfo/Idh/MocA family oxidoreductase [Bacillus sp. ISL-35]|uniref:Gfo/Idh/MocA family protein n=1 Tax=Bacillus sp. ISL-35 TaxID=2819122 RepID=UPI001BEBA037|nr:Gfo/Idh/MocA family oxidoreductase [Bacillus sp. ISL-35]MBT2678749.1 Gfo/Idh/MocA family oxidoreductase [Bacillus sp. ISL-35]MBT2703741.1 Gfo/Idh/MocA family oxidoreductase [Chryseobacterium sp. ISL-80]
MRKIKWGILSTANIAQTQVIPAIQRSASAEVEAIASSNGKAAAAAAELNIPRAYETYEELLQDPTIDAVYIPLPNSLHRKWVLEAARNGKHVLCEKPAALTAEEMIEMDRYCKEQNVLFMEAFMYQFHPQHERVKEIIASGEIGEVKLMRSSFSFYMEDRDTNIRMDRSLGGGSIYDIGCYCIHAMRTILEAEPANIHVHGKLDPDTGVDVSAVAYMEFDQGIQGVFDCSFEASFRNEYEIVGTKGRVLVPNAFRPDVSDGVGSIIVESEGQQRTEQVEGDIYLAEVDHFSEAILEKKPLIYPAEKTIANMRVIDACYSSLKKDEKVTV